MTTIKHLRDVDLKEVEGRGTVSAVFATLGVVDLDGDVTRKGAFTDGAPVVISAYGHGSWDGMLPVGKGVISEVADEAILNGHFLLSTTHGRDTWETVKELSEAGLQEWSYSLHNVTAEKGELDGREVRYLNKIDVKEVSPVLKGAGVNTRTLVVKAEDTKFSDHKAAVLTAVDEVIERALEVVTLRVQDGKSFGSVKELREALNTKATEFARRMDELTHPPGDDAAIKEFLRSVAIAQGVTT